MTKLYTLAEVEEHRSNDDLWIIIHGGVYDITKFLDKHPGGIEVLVEHAGMDGSSSFEDIGHSDYARELLEEFKIGQLDTQTNPPNLTLNKAPAPPAFNNPPRQNPLDDSRIIIAATIGIASILVGILSYHYFSK